MMKHLTKTFLEHAVSPVKRSSVKFASIEIFMSQFRHSLYALPRHNEEYSRCKAVGFKIVLSVRIKSLKNFSQNMLATFPSHACEQTSMLLSEKSQYNYDDCALSIGLDNRQVERCDVVL